MDWILRHLVSAFLAALGIFAVMYFLGLMVDAIALAVILLLSFYLELRERDSEGASILAQHSPAERRGIALDYQVKITGKAGNTWNRAALFGVIVWILLRLIWLLGTFIPMPADIRWTITLGTTVIIVLLISLFFIVSVPKLAMIIVTNRFTGRMHVLTPGLNIIFPWERYNRGRIVSTEAERHREHSDVLSQRSGEIKRSSEFLTKDGIVATLSNWILQWGPFLPLAPLNIRFAEADISNTTAEIVESTLFQEILGRTVEELRSKEAIDAIEDALVAALAGAGAHQKDAFDHNIQERNGIVAEMPALGPMRFSEDYEEAIRTEQTLNIMKRDAKSLAEELQMEGGQAFDSVMIVNKEKVEKKIVKPELDLGVRDILKDIGGAFGRAISGAVSPRNDNTPPTNS